MKGFVPVDIPTKKYIKAYILAKLGAQPLMTLQGNSIGRKLYDLMEHSTNERADQFSSKHYTEKVKVYIPIRQFKRRGVNLNSSNIKNFNLFVEEELKHRFHTLMDDFVEQLPNVLSNLPEIRRRLGIDFEDWNDEAMIKSYYRYRKATGKSYYLPKYEVKSLP